MSSSTRDNWQRLVEAVMKREQYLQLCHRPYSRSPSISTIASGSDYSDQILNLEPSTAFPSPHQLQPTKRPPTAQARRANRRKGKGKYVTDDIAVHMGQVRRFSLDELEVATESFSEKNIFSYGLDIVHIGWLTDGSPVAVKRFRNRGYSSSADSRFQLQVEVYSIVAHPNILCLLGFCSTQEQRLLIYPLMPYGSVASRLRGLLPLIGEQVKRALGTARGLAYLHEKRIIHCNIKASNILLNEDFKPVIAGFGSAIIIECDSTYVVRDTVKGTIGHIAPEYWINRVCSEKTDVFSYGVFLLELITGLRAFNRARWVSGEGMKLLEWFMRNYKEKQWKIVAEKNCGGDETQELVEQLIVIALICIEHGPEQRPKMSEIIRMLEVGETMLSDGNGIK